MQARKSEPSPGSPESPGSGGAAQPVVDGFAESVVGNRHHRDGPRAAGIEGAKIAEKIGGGLPEIAALGQVHHGGRGLAAGESGRAEGQQGLAA